jgi:hypothetical protein
MKRLVLLQGDEVLVGDLVKHNSSEGSNVLLNNPVGRSLKRLALVPSRFVRQSLTSRFDGPLIVVGARSRTIPLGKFPASLVWFYRSLLDFIDIQDRDQDSLVEVEVLSGSDLPKLDLVGTPRFSLLEGKKRLGYLTGKAAVRYQFEGRAEDGILQLWIHQFIDMGKSGMGNGGNPVGVDISMWSESESILWQGEAEGEEAKGVRAGDDVTIRFRRGSILLVIPGKAYRSGSMGEPIVVYTKGKYRRFTGTVVGAKEVEVDVP